MTLKIKTAYTSLFNKMPKNWIRMNTELPLKNHKVTFNLQGKALIISSFFILSVIECKFSISIYIPFSLNIPYTVFAEISDAPVRSLQF